MACNLVLHHIMINPDMRCVAIKRPIHDNDHWRYQCGLASATLRPSDHSEAVTMFLQIPDVLTAVEIQRLRSLAQTLTFIDGRATNPDARDKQNLQIDQNDPAVAEPGEIVRNALFRNPALRAFAFPVRLARPTLSKYQPGMHYGKHTDAAIFPSQPTPMRSDVSCTVFISEPSEYEGGELTVYLGDRDVALRGEAGSAVLYPSTSIHEVKPVTSGERLVAVAWMQSCVVDPMHRQILHALGKVAMQGEALSKEARVDLEFVRTNLTRMWSAL